MLIWHTYTLNSNDHDEINQHPSLQVVTLYVFYKFQVSNTILLTIITMLYFTTTEDIHLITASLYILTNSAPFSPILSPWQQPFLCFYEYNF